MRSILDIGNQGAECMDVAAPRPSVAVEGVQRFTPIVDKFPTSRVESEVNDGTKRSLEVHTLLLNNPQVFALVWEMAMYEPMVYARKGNRTAMGILSPNFDEHGASRLPTVKVLSLKTPYPLVSRGTDLLPDAQMATMLAGSAHAEGKGSGGHDKPPEQDYEHRLTFIGAISLGKNTITENGRHLQHAERTRTSVATGLTNGSLGNIFAADGDRTGGFTGYDIPLTFQQGAAQLTDAIFFPKSFLHNEAAYGVHYTDASRIAYGAGLQIMYQRQGQQAVSDQIKQIARSA
ncbi:MAG: hypothetical protein ACREGB_00285 [Candidatus Saccharimonadales bacterium]